jgi:hypothetical protein
MPTAPDNIYTATAQCLATARTVTWTEAQLVTLDYVIELLCDEYASRSHRFSPELFCQLSKYQHQRSQPKESA